MAESASSPSGSPYPPPAKRRKYRAIYDDEDEEDALTYTLPSEAYDIFDFIRFCDTPVDDVSLVPQMRDFARRLQIEGWNTLSKAELCKGIRSRLSLLNLPQDLLLSISEFLPVDTHSILRDTSKEAKQLLPALTNAQRLVDIYGGRAYQVLFGTLQLDIDNVEYEAAEMFIAQNSAYFNEHDLNVLDSNITPDQPWSIEFVPKIVRQVVPATRAFIVEEHNRQIQQNRNVAVTICLVRVGTTAHHGRDIVACATLTSNGNSDRRTVQQFTIPQQAELYVESKIEQVARDAQYNTTSTQFRARDGWFIVIERQRDFIAPWISFESECAMKRRSQIARVYMDATAWSMTYQKQQPESHPVLALIPKPIVGVTFWSSKAQEEQAIRDLFDYEVVTSTGRRVRLPLASWVRAIIDNRNYREVARMLFGAGRETEYNPLVLRYMSPLWLHEDIFLRLQKRVRQWWQDNVYPDIPAPPPRFRPAIVAPAQQ